MITGFQLRALRAAGKGKTPAEVVFGPGFNVISGASNTGKSYILQCIDFMLGGSKRPKRIKESNGYESLFLELEDQQHRTHQLERSLSGHAFVHRIIANGAVTSEETLSEKHDPNEKDTVSALLLGLSSAGDRKIRQNQSGKTRGLSFRDLSWLALVDEMRIISDESPVLSGQYTTRTEELSIFKLLLTGVDDASVIATESRKESKARQKAQLELLDRLIPELEAEIGKLDKEPASIEERRKRTDAAVATRTEVLTASQKEISDHEEKRREAWEKAKQLERQQATTIELRRRFTFLEEHYNNDLARLQAIIEMDSYFSQLRQVRCPLCGASTDQHDPSAHDDQPPDNLENIRNACRAEIAKIKGLLRDLVGTTTQLDSELSTIKEQYSAQASLFETTTREILTRLAPAAKQYETELTEVMSVRDRLAHAGVLHERLLGLQAERAKIASFVWKPEPKEDASDILVSQSIEAFTLKVQSLLEEWKYPDLTRVTFSDEKVDLVISGKERASEGKGFRAIAYAAFMIALLDYCADSNLELPHPGIVVLDSPLVTYKRRDFTPGEEISEDVTAAFYEALAKLPAGRQVIVLENNDPPATLHSEINYTHFSRSTTGRYGFYPIS
jgi:AAA domain